MTRPLKLRIGCLLITAAAGLLACGTATAAVMVSGFLNDSTNTALVSSDGGADPVLRYPRFGDDNEIARNVAVYKFNVASAGTINFTSSGYAAGGAEPYFSLFSGSGLAAGFVDSNLFDPSIDFSLSLPLAAGDYVFAIGVWMNMSFAENSPDADPSLGDGFTALGEPGRLGTYYYELSLDTIDATFSDPTPLTGIAQPPLAAPEPSALLLVVTALLLFGTALRLRGRRQLG